MEDDLIDKLSPIVGMKDVRSPKVADDTMYHLCHLLCLFRLQGPHQAVLVEMMLVVENKSEFTIWLTLEVNEVDLAPGVEG